MFVIKQYNRQDLDYSAWACKSYSVKRNEYNTCIKMEPLTPENALPEMLYVTGRVYIENAVGKTIDRFESPEDSQGIPEPLAA